MVPLLSSRVLSLYATLCLALAALPAGAEIPAEVVARLKPMVVNIEKSVPIGINGDQKASSSAATGFVVDAKRGIIATNAHVTGTSPCRVKIVFENGRTTQARLLHYDAWHDFGFFQIDATQLGFPLTAAVLGDSFALREQDEILLIGNAARDEYTVKFGRISNLYLNKELQRHSAMIQTTIDRAGGASGSPVFNRRGEVVALHSRGDDSNSFEVRIEYLKDALDQLQRGGHVRRGEIGIAAELLLVADAQEHFHLPEALARRVRALRLGLKRMVMVRTTIPRSAAHDRLLPGDLLLSVDGTWIGDDLYRLDRLVDQKVGAEVEIQAVRNGREVSLRLPVADAEAGKARRFVEFGGGVFQDPTPRLRHVANYAGDGVFLAQVDSGSSLLPLGVFQPVDHLRVPLATVEALNGVPTPDLAAFIAAARDLKDGDHVYFVVRTMQGNRAWPVTLNLKFSPLKVSRWSQQDLDWSTPADDR